MFQIIFGAIALGLPLLVIGEGTGVELVTYIGIGIMALPWAALSLILCISLVFGIGVFPSNKG
ncbi:hypothetical protein LCGC14_2484060 [marine sediment metagenome]|uniref:Uncharacterized protein n=1 Tax=marine sediment metagenome TaxID=412755 RepID=A0A0F9E0E6_9ZZZZ